MADRWRAQYGTADGTWKTSSVLGSCEDIYNRLCALGPTPDIAAVAEIIGNKSWSYLSCDGCNASVERAVRIGSEDYEAPKRYCEICIREAALVLALPETPKEEVR